MLHQAAKRLQREGYSTIGGFLSPTHDGYLQGKARSLGTVGFSGNFRLHIARLTVENDSLVEASDWEVAQPRFVNFPEVAKALKDYLAAEGCDASLKATAFYVSGTDHTSRCGLAMGFPYNIGLVVVPRTGERAPVEVPGKVYVSEAAEGEVASFSSTKVREALARGDHDYISNALSPEAARFLLQPTSEELRTFEEDFRKIGFPETETPETGGYAQEPPKTGGYA